MIRILNIRITFISWIWSHYWLGGRNTRTWRNWRHSRPLNNSWRRKECLIIWIDQGYFILETMCLNSYVIVNIW